ncbi:aminoacrylate hydrolase [Chlorella sorokiniana]|uniref:Aminoacrylate hydrolase n=1 Tax=Chlorella sorokiniana TaxID=3076 RepID=A0A2P6TPC1_CHLSO|nr:aminoacrylate hydrolase [Chlorella sorokiniana]|eukprot:PRW51180.1 aminoacrylate hydrolase [Chlorella sorokiniana]
MLRRHRHALPAAAALLLLAVATPLTAAAADDSGGSAGAASQLPPQCQLDDGSYPPHTNLTFLGPARAIQAGGIDWSYHRFGNASAGQPPLVMIHGLGGTQYDWPMRVLQGLAAGREVVIFDNPRAGLSNDSSTAPLSIEGMAESTMQLLRALELEQPDVLGFSMGGMVALALAAEYSVELGAVVAVGGSAGGPDAPQPEGGMDAVLRAIVEAGPESINLVFPGGTNDTEGYCNLMVNVASLQLAVTPQTDSTDSGYGLRAGIIPSPAALSVSTDVKNQQREATDAFYTGPSLVPQLRNSSSQILLLAGGQDRVIPPTTQSQLAAQLLAANLVQVPDAGHLVAFQHPDGFAQQVASFLDAAQAVDPQQLAPFYPAAAQVDAPPH